MRGVAIGSAVASVTAIIIGGDGIGASAADLNTKAPETEVSAGPVTCASVVDFFTNPCVVSAYGLRFYGNIDVGIGYQSNGARLDKFTAGGDTWFPQHLNNGPKLQFAQNASSISDIGFQLKEPLGAGWSLVGQVEAAFNPASLDLVSGPGALRDVIGQKLGSALGVFDSSTNGQLWNDQGYIGFSHDTWGTLTFFRQTNLVSDSFSAYDPIGSGPAISLIMAAGTFSGGGATETQRAMTSVKYRVNIGDYRIGLYGQFGGYDEGNAAKGNFQGQVGADYHVGPGILSLDAVGGYAKDAVVESLTVANATLPSGAGNPEGTITGVGASISDNTVATALAKYSLERFTIYAGYEWIKYAPPSDPATSFTDMAGDQFGTGSVYTISNTAYNAGDKVVNVAWFGGRYSLTSSVTGAVAYYHVDQPAFGTKIGASSAGTTNVVSGILDWRFAPKWDTYVSIMYDKLDGGMASGYIANSFLVSTAGIRFRW